MNAHNWIAIEAFHGFESWGLQLANGTFCLVSFDREYPEMGWRASYRKPADPTTHYLDRFNDKTTAMTRVIEQASEP